ncbi:thyroglobulin isoform X14 [Physeter macrocephalus]|uniref:Thyroglobulin n=1 Tax=Physeter macrocephalus TaxID=9755 RepID=A0A455CBH2_PHYMC|nr:thyroglobulin isoform X14 [Physeter catodon]
MALALAVFSLLGSACLVSANSFEYQVDAQPLRPCEQRREAAFLKGADYVPQCAEDGSFQTVQCGKDGGFCWCVDADGREVPGSRQPGRPASCLSFCQLQKQQILLSSYINSTATSYLPQCQDSGDYEPMQCDLRRGQCWCVDTEGMEVYGTRQRGRPTRCPGSCEIRNRRLLHGVGDKSPPQCSPDGAFVSVQCKFVNTTDTMIFDLVHSYNRFPDAFVTFSSFRRRFPEVSGYCHCVDSQGRELAETGLELLLDEIYDTVFAGLDLAATFTETTLYRILQRRFLAVQLVISGRFRCPTKCEVERFTATSFGHPCAPSCRPDGEYEAVQCQRDGPCWCVDAQGRELQGTRRQGEPPFCGPGSCEEVKLRVLQFIKEAEEIVMDSNSSRFPLGESFLAAKGIRLTDEELALPRLSPPRETFLEKFLSGSDYAIRLAALSTTCESLPRAIFVSCFSPSPAISFGGQGARLTLYTLGPGTALSRERGPGKCCLTTLGSCLLFSSLLPPSLPSRPAFDFYQRLRVHLGKSPRASTPLRSSPYVPQCDAFGSWEPVQCHAATGHCWCVDGKGEYVPTSLAARSPQILQCPTSCEKSRARALLSSWKQAGSQGKPSPKDLFIPTCLETGEFARLQVSEASTWCVDPASGEGTPPGTNSSAQCPSLCEVLQSGVPSRRASPGYAPACTAEDGGFSPVQCDPAQGSCWCVLGNGEEVPGTRVAGSQPACESPQCPLPFNVSDVASGALLCAPASGPGGAAVQRCQLLCRPGYRSAFPPGPLLCSLQRRRWESQPPQPRACQRPQLWQTLWTQGQLQLQLPPGKVCHADYAGLLPAFQIFLLDELTARGFCQIQVKTAGTPVSIPVCDDFTVRVECLSGERLGANVTWKLRLEDVPPASLPDLRDVEEALVGKDLVGRFADLIQSGKFQLHLDSKTFPADTSIRFLQGDRFGTSPRTQFGCLEGFHQVSATSNASQDPLGCVKCPEGSYFQDEQCIPCPAGFYQEQAGSLACVPCPAGRTTVSTGAFSRTHCVTGCQKNEAGLQCDQDGQYRASQRDGASGKAFCVDGEGQRLPWSETEALLMDAQCLMMRKFEKLPESKVIFDADVAVVVKSQVPGSESSLTQCLADCALDETCSFLTVSTAGSEVSCDFYAWASDNIACTTSGREEDALGTSKATSFGSLMCQVKARSGGGDSPAVYLKKGQEFTTTGQKRFEQTGFQSVLSGMYSPVAFSASGASLTEVHLFCLLACDRDSCCDGFILTQVQGGSIICGLLSSPDVLLCHVRDWRDPSEAQAKAACPGVTYEQDSRQATLRLGGQEFKSLTPLKGNQSTFTSFQQVYLWKDSDMGSRSESVGCRRAVEARPASPAEADLTTDLFSPVDLNQVIVNGNRSLPSQLHWLFKHLFSLQQANLWCLSRCVQEPSFCQLAEVTDSAPLYFTCTLYPEAQVCDDVLESSPKGCRLILPRRPSALFQKKVVLQDKVKQFYTRLPFQKLMGISIRNKVPMFNKSISNGFFECERLCDVDPCCTGFGFLNVSQLKGGEVTCLTLNSLGIQMCSEENGGAWRILDCGSPDAEVRTYPFGWYQKPVAQNDASSFCPSVALPPLTENDGISQVTPHSRKKYENSLSSFLLDSWFPECRPSIRHVALDSWQSLALSSVVVDPSIRNFDVAHISTPATGDFSAARDRCLWECSHHQACLVTTLQTQPGAVRCMFYADTQSCTHSLQAQNCQLLLREEATHIYQKPNIPLVGFGTSAPSVTLTTHGRLLGRSQAIQVGASWKQVDQFLGVPYATPPLAGSRFRAPEPWNWTGSWDAAKPRASCWQPGARTPSSPGVSEDCLYLNVFVPQNVAPSASVLVFFHDAAEGRASGGRPAVDGSFLAAVGNLIVVTASYRVGVFGFLSSGELLALVGTADLLKPGVFFVCV